MTKNNKIRIGYFADGPWSHAAFKKIIADPRIEIDFICARFDSKDETLKGYCNEFGIDYIKHKNVNSSEFIGLVANYNSDLFVSMSFNQIFGKELMNLPRLKTINCHAGKLPFYRGRNILNWALINDEKDFGITVHYLDEGIDTGDIIIQRTYKISDEDNYATLLKIAHVECANILFEAIELIIENKVVTKRQIEIHPTGLYCCKRIEGDEIIDWNQSSRDIFNFIRAICFPGPVARTFCRGVEVRINKCIMVNEAPFYKGVPGAILEVSNNYILVKTKDSFVKITEFESAQKIYTGNRFYSKQNN